MPAPLTGRYVALGRIAASGRIRFYAIVSCKVGVMPGSFQTTRPKLGGRADDPKRSVTWRISDPKNR